MGEKKNEEEEEEMFIVYMFVLRLDDVQRTEEERTKPRKRTEIVTMLRLFLSLSLSPFSLLVIIDLEEDENLLWSSCSNHRACAHGSGDGGCTEHEEKKGQREKKAFGRSRKNENERVREKWATSGLDVCVCEL